MDRRTDRQTDGQAVNKRAPPTKYGGALNIRVQALTDGILPLFLSETYVTKTLTAP